LFGEGAEGFEGDVFDAGGVFGDGEELGGFGAVVLAAGILPGGVGLEEEAVGGDLTEGVLEFEGGRGAAEGSAERKVGSEIDPGLEVVCAAAPGVEEDGGGRVFADGGEEIVPDVADGVEGAGAVELLAKAELAAKGVALGGKGGAGELAVEADFADAGAGDAVKEVAEAGLPVVGAVGEPGVESEVGMDGGVVGEGGDLHPVVGGGAVDEEGGDVEGGGAGADLGEGAVGDEFLEVAVGVGPAGVGGDGAGVGAGAEGTEVHDCLVYGFFRRDNRMNRI